MGCDDARSCARNGVRIGTLPIRKELPPEEFRVVRDLIEAKVKAPLTISKR